MKAYRIKDLAKPNGPIARSTLYKHAAEGRLIMRRVGGATVVLEADWLRYLEGVSLTVDGMPEAANHQETMNVNDDDRAETDTLKLELIERAESTLLQACREGDRLGFHSVVNVMVRFAELLVSRPPRNARLSEFSAPSMEEGGCGVVRWHRITNENPAPDRLVFLYSPAEVLGGSLRSESWMFCHPDATRRTLTHWAEATRPTA